MRPFVAVLLFAGTLAAPVAAQGSKPVTIDLKNEKVGKEPQKFLPMVGDWVVSSDEGRHVILVDGRKWKRGQPAGGLADKAREIYGARHEDFIDNVKAFAYFPIAVAKDIDNFENGEIRVKFKMIGGALDRCGTPTQRATNTTRGRRAFRWGATICSSPFFVRCVRRRKDLT